MKGGGATELSDWSETLDRTSGGLLALPFAFSSHCRIAHTIAVGIMPPQNRILDRGDDDGMSLLLPMIDLHGQANSAQRSAPSASPRGI